MIGLQTIGYARLRQLLINNDFQVNQRGKNEYTETGKTLDMWLSVLSNSNTLKVTDYGVLINKVNANQVVLRQRNPNFQNIDVGQHFTLRFVYDSNISFINTIGFGSQRKEITVEVGKKEYIYTFTLNSADIDSNGNVDIIVFNNISSVCQCKVYPCDLFEGDIAYPHVKEDYAIALDRCMDYIQSLVDKSYGNRIIMFISNGSTVLEGIQFFKPMKGVPSVEKIVITDSSGTSIEDIYAHTSRCELRRISINNENFIKNTYAYLHELIVTCEPLS